MAAAVFTDGARRSHGANHKYFLRIIFHAVVLTLLPNETIAQAEHSLMSLISPRDIAQITQLATDLAAQTMNSNADILSKPGRPEVRPISLDQSPSEMLGQSLTNIWQPASQQLMSQLTKDANGGGDSTKMAKMRAAATASASDDSDNDFALRPAGHRGGSASFKPVTSASAQNNAMSALLSLGGLRPPSNKDDAYDASPLQFDRRQSRPQGALGAGEPQQSAAMNSIMELANTFLGAGTDDPASRRSAANSYFSEDNGGSINSGAGGGIARLLSMTTGSGNRKNGGGYQMPTLRQFLPLADRNFGVDQGEGCLPFLGEFMKIAYGNCVKQADQRTWDTWGKEIQNALMGGKIDLLKASRETCKKGAEREQCGQVRRAVSECDIIGSIQLISNMQRSISRCDEISGIIDQNPTTVLSQMNGLINGEMAQGFINNFLG